MIPFVPREEVPEKRSFEPLGNVFPHLILKMKYMCTSCMCTTYYNHYYNFISYHIIYINKAVFN